MKIKPRSELLNDLIRDSKKKSEGWKAAFYKDSNLLSNDYYILNPNVGVYLIKEYQKNPFRIEGIGSKIARKVDEDVEESIIKNSGDFGIVQGDINKIVKNIKKGVHPQTILEQGIKGKDMGIKVPLKGKASSSKNTIDKLNNSYSKQKKKIDMKFSKKASDEGLYSSYD